MAAPTSHQPELRGRSRLGAVTTFRAGGAGPPCETGARLRAARRARRRRRWQPPGRGCAPGARRAAPPPPLPPWGSFPPCVAWARRAPRSKAFVSLVHRLRADVQGARRNLFRASFTPPATAPPRPRWPQALRNLLHAPFPPPAAPLPAARGSRREPLLPSSLDGTTLRCAPRLRGTVTGRPGRAGGRSAASGTAVRRCSTALRVFSTQASATSPLLGPEVQSVGNSPEAGRLDNVTLSRRGGGQISARDLQGRPSDPLVDKGPNSAQNTRNAVQACAPSAGDRAKFGLIGLRGGCGRSPWSTSWGERTAPPTSGPQ